MLEGPLWTARWAAFTEVWGRAFDDGWTGSAWIERWLRIPSLGYARRVDGLGRESYVQDWNVTTTGR